MAKKMALETIKQAITQFTIVDNHFNNWQWCCMNKTERCNDYGNCERNDRRNLDN